MNVRLSTSLCARIAAAVLFAAIVAACSGGTTGSLPAGSGPEGAAPNAAPAPARVRDAAVRLVIRVPRHKHRRSHYVSASSGSAEVAVAPASGCSKCTPGFSLDVGLTATSSPKDCTTGAGGVTCTIALTLSPGTYTGSLTTYDGPPGCQSAAGPCKALSLNQSFPMTVVAGNANAPSITLDGIPASVTFTDLDAGTIVDHNPARAIFGLVGASSSGRLQVNAADADGNFILGPGAPTYSATVGNGFTATVSGNVIVLTAPAAIAAGTTPLAVKLTSPACTAPGADCTPPSDSVEFEPVVAGVDSASIDIYVSNLTNKPFASVTTGVDKPVAATFAPSGDLFVANSGNATVTRYLQPYTGAPAATGITGLVAPSILAVAPNGTLAVGDTGSGSVFIYASPYTSKLATISSGTPLALAFDASDNLWVGTAGNVKRYSAASAYAASTLTLDGADGITTPVSIAFDAAGDAYVGDRGAGDVYEFDTPFAGAATHSYAPAGTIDQVLVSGNNVFACSSGAIEALTTQGLEAPKEITPINDGAPAQFCALDQNADVYNTDDTYGTLAEFTAPAFGYDGYLTEQLKTPVALAAFP